MEPAGPETGGATELGQQMLNATESLLRRAAAALALLALLAGCAADRNTAAVTEQTAETLYETANAQLRDGRYAEAARTFEDLDRQHPYSRLAVDAQIMAAYSYYKNDDDVSALAALDRFIELHPGNRSAPYAYYLRAIVHYERIADVQRDQSRTLQALNSLREVARRYPDSAYARDARLKITLAEAQLAAKEMAVGRYYLNERDYVAAANRFLNVVRDYQTTGQTPEALYRLVEIYLTLGIVGEARTNAAVLGHNFPDSAWYRRAYALMREAEAQAPEKTG